MRLRLAVTIALVLLLAGQWCLVGVWASQTSSTSGALFYFHYRNELFRSEDASVTVLEEANFSLPIGLTPRLVDVAAAIRNATTIFGSVWVGSVAWMTQPFAEPAKIRGPVIFTAWMSSDDVTPTFSGVGAGVAVLNQQNQTVGSYVYSYSYAQGKILPTKPKEYEFTVNLERDIASGQRLVFAVGAGSTTQGWRIKVYFDGAQFPSRAQLPSTVIVLPEFEGTTAVLVPVLALILTIGPDKAARGRKQSALTASHYMTSF